MGKVEIRKKILSIRNLLDRNEKEKSDNEIFNKLINLDIYIKANSIFIYVSFGSEIDTIKIINHALENNKKVYVPKTDKVNKTMIAVRIFNFNDMIPDNWGILEPREVTKENIGTKFDLIIMPGIAFDIEGNRVGYGGGYYDKYIESIGYTNYKIALAYEFQLLNNIETEIHDIKVESIITKNEIIKTKYITKKR